MPCSVPVTRYRVFAAIPLLFAVGCNCGDGTQKVRPQASVSSPRACTHASPDSLPICLQFHDTRGDTRSAPLSLALKSDNAAKLTVKSIALAGDDAAAFVLGEKGPKVVTTGTSLPIPITFAPPFTPGDAVHPWDSPHREEWYLAKVVIETDDPKTPTIQVGVVGHGVEPFARVDPTSADFGLIQLGQISATLPLTLYNDGTHPPGEPNDTAAALTVSATHFEGDPGFVIDPPPVANLKVWGGNSQGPFSLYFRPVQGGDANGKLVLDTDDPVTPRIEIPLHAVAKANVPPTACVGLYKVLDHFEREKQRPDGGYLVAPFDRVYLSAHPATDNAAPAQSSCPDDSVDPDGAPDGGPAYAWGPLQMPAGSLATHDATDDVTQQALAPWQREVRGLDLEGQYGLEVKVTDPFSASATAVQQWSVLRRGIAVELSWPANQTDLDLHLVRPPWTGESGNGVCGCRDCFFGDCKLKQTGKAPLDWGALAPDDTGSSPNYDDDPLLDRDSTGDNPLLETISVDLPYDGDYEVYVHFLSDARSPRLPVDATVKVWLGQNLGGTWTLSLAPPANNLTTLWHVATIHWNGGAGGSTVTPISGTPTSLISPLLCNYLSSCL